MPGTVTPVASAKAIPGTPPLTRILFVDDEPAILDALRGRLRCLRSRFQMVFVESAARALAEMELQPADVIVADMRMPAMDGAQLLSVISERWPQTIRLVLSGYAEDTQTARLLTVAHQYLSKPCEPSQIENALERCARLRDLLATDALRAVVGGIKQLPVLPQVYARLRNAMTDPNSSIEQIAAIISEDPAIAAKILQIVNSAFFRLARRITRLDHAVSHLGFNAIRTLVMSVEVFSAWNTRHPVAGFEPERLQHHARRVAAAARVLCGKSPIADDALLAGLFHNIGYWILTQERPDELARAQELTLQQGITLPRAERQVLGASNAEVGAYLLGVWGLPHAIIEAVAFQDDPRHSAAHSFDVHAALSIAQILVAEGEPPTAANSGARALAEELMSDDQYLISIKAPFDWAEARHRVAGQLEDTSDE